MGEADKYPGITRSCVETFQLCNPLFGSIPGAYRKVLIMLNQKDWTAFCRLAEDSPNSTPKEYWKLILSLGKTRYEIESAQDTAGTYTLQTSNLICKTLAHYILQIHQGFQII